MAFSLPNAANDVYPHNRTQAFERIRVAVNGAEAFGSEAVSLSIGDAVEWLPRIPDESVDLVLVDPPYHSTKKANIYGDADFEHDDQFVSWIVDLGKQWRRVLRANGSLYLFCSSEMAPRLYVALSTDYNLQSMITWTKPNEPGYDGWRQKMNKRSLRRWYPHSERVLFCTPAVEGNLKRAPFGHFLKQCRISAGLTSNQLTELTGAYGRVNNGGAVSNWETGRNIPSREQYSKICAAICNTGRIKYMPQYEDVIRAFDVDPQKPFTDVWDFMNVRQYKGKHPAEKPQDMLQHIIATSSYKNDIVLDCFAGSGSTLAAARRLGRKAVGVEIEGKWVNYASDFIESKTQEPLHESSRDQSRRDSKQSKDLPLFAT